MERLAGPCAREPLALNLKERRVVLDDDGAPAAIVQRAQSESQRLIEDYMIAANVAAAEALIKAQRPCVFRVHDQPDPEKTEGFATLQMRSAPALRAARSAPAPFQRHPRACPRQRRRKDGE